MTESHDAPRSSSLRQGTTRRTARVAVAWGPLALVVAAGCGAGSESAPLEEGAIEAQQRLGTTCVTLRRTAAQSVADASIGTDALDATRAVANFGSAQTLQLGTVGTTTWGSLLRFDLSAVPSGAVVSSATLKLLQGSRLGSGPALVHRITMGWSESTVTWSTFGSAFDPNVASTFSPNGVVPGAFLSTDLTGLTQGWVSGVFPNHGLYIEEPGGARAFYGSSELGNMNHRPALTVCYCVPQPEVCNGLDDDCDGAIDDVVCEDGNPCTTDACAGLLGCQASPVADGTPLPDDGDVCNGDDLCVGGTAATTLPLLCSDGYACTADTCDPTLGCQSAGLQGAAPYARTIGPVGSYSAIDDITTDAAGNTYVLGTFMFSVDPGNGPLYADTANYGWDTTDSFVAKYSPSGAVLWVTPLYDGGTDSRGGGIATDGVEVFVAAVQAVANQYCYQFADVNLTRLNATTGALGWSTGVGADGVVLPGAVSITPAGHPVVSFAHHASNVCNGYVGLYTVQVQSRDRDTALLLWTADLPGDAAVTVGGMATDAAGYTSLIGDFSASLQVGATSLSAVGSSDVFVARFDGSGVPLWATSVASPGMDSAGSVAVDAAGNTYVAATLSGSVSIGGGPVLPGAGGTDALLARLDSAGTPVWSQLLGGPAQETGSRLVLDAGGVLHLLGSYENGADFGGGPLSGTGTYVTKRSTAGGFGGQGTLPFIAVSGPSWDKRPVVAAADCAGRLSLGGSTTGLPAPGVGAIPVSEAAVVAP